MTSVSFTSRFVLALCSLSTVQIAHGFQLHSSASVGAVSSRRLGDRHTSTSKGRYGWNSHFPVWQPIATAPHRCDRPQRKSNVELASTEASNDSGDVSNAASIDRKLDFGAIYKYIAAIGIQMSLFTLLLSGLDAVTGAYRIQVPLPLNVVLFYFVALKSRVLNPLNNQRPNLKKTGKGKGFGDRKMPKFTPPGVIFPIVWLLIIGPLRAFTSALVYRTSRKYATSAILSLMLHLSIGDVWNTINNTERRYGTSAVVIIFVALSKAWAAYQYYQISPLAGQLLALALIWFGIAGTLIWETWRINPVDGDRLDTLYPNRGAAVSTKFAWFAKKDSE